MSDFRMTSDPYRASSFPDGEEREAAMQFAKTHRMNNFISQQPRVEDSAYGSDRVHLPTFAGDLWVTRSK
jgi:hypothetical protein